MKKSLVAVGLLGVVFAVLLPAPVTAAPQLFGREPKKEDKTRLLTGKVIDGSDGPLPNAVVYLTNTHDHSVKTYIVGPEGTFRFPALQPTIDYEVYAQFDKRRSHTKTVSQFDNRTQVYIDLKIDAK
jgi:hypothetical protein